MMTEDLSTLPWDAILSVDVFSFFTDSIQDYGVPTEVVNGQSTAEVQPKDAALPPATAPVQSSTSAPSSDILSSDLPTDNGVPVLSGDTMRALLQDVVPAQSGCEPARPANDTATEGNQASAYTRCLVHSNTCSSIDYYTLLPAVGKDLQDHIPLSKLAALKKEDNMHLQLVDQAKEFTAKLGSISIPAFLDNDASFVLDLPNDRHGVREELRDLQAMLEISPLNEKQVNRRIKMLLGYWTAMYEEPRPAALAQLMTHMASLAQRLEGDTSSSIEANSVMEEGHQQLGELDTARSMTVAELKRHAEERDEAQAKYQPLKMEQQNAAKEARDFEEKARSFQEEARVAWAREKELLGKEEELLKNIEFCRGHIKTLEARLEQLEECRRNMKAQLEDIGQLEDPVSRGVKLILKYSFLKDRT